MYFNLHPRAIPRTVFWRAAPTRRTMGASATEAPSVERAPPAGAGAATARRRTNDIASRRNAALELGKPELAAVLGSMTSARQAAEQLLQEALGGATTTVVVRRSMPR